MSKTTVTDVLVTQLTIDGKKYNLELKKAAKGVKRLEKQTKTSVMAMRNSFLMYAAAIYATTRAVGKLIDLHVQQEKVEKRVEAVIKATGSAAGFTTQQVKGMAQQFQTLTGVGDEVILRGQAILLTFKEIKGDQFRDATQAMLDMSSVMDGDFKAAAIQLGKALNNPILGVSALAEVGVSFTQQQKDSIRTFQEQNNIMAAQQVILDELQGEFGGAAQANLETMGGQMSAFAAAVGDLGEAFINAQSGPMMAFLRTLTKIMTLLNTPAPDDSMGSMLFSVGGDDAKFASAGAQLRSGDSFLGMAAANQRAAAILKEQQAAKTKAYETGDSTGQANLQGWDAYVAAQALAYDMEQANALKQGEAMLEKQATDRDARIEFIADTYEREQAMALENSNALIAIQENELASKLAIEAAKRRVMSEGMKTMKALFPQSKEVLIAEAIMNTHAGITKALSAGPPPWNFIQAALVGAQGFASVKAIQQAKPGGGRGGRAGGGGGGGTSLPSSGAQGAQDITLNIVGADPLVNKDALGQLFFDSLGELLEATGGRTGNVTVAFRDN